MAGRRASGDEISHHIAGDAAEHGGLRDTIAAQAVGAVDTAGILTGREEPVDRRAARGVDDDAAHHEVCRRADLDRPAREIPAEVTTAPDHAAEVPLDHVGAEVRDVDPHAAVRRPATLRHLEERGPRDEIAGRALHPRRIVPLHVPLAAPVLQMAAGAAQPFLEERARHQRVRDDETRRMELDHLHVAQRQPRAIPERDAVGGLVGRTRDDLVHGGPAAHRQQGGAGGHDDESPLADVEEERARAAPRAVEQELDRATLFERQDILAPEHLLREAVHDLDAGQVALVDRPIVRLAGKGLLMDPPLGRAVEEAPVARLELEHSAGRLDDESPHELLVVDPPAARERVEEMRLERVGRRQHRVVPALHHARTARAAQQPLDDDGDRKIGRPVGGVEGGTEPGAAGAKDEHVRLDGVDWSHQAPILIRDSGEPPMPSSHAVSLTL